MPRKISSMSCYSGSDASPEPPDTEIFDREITQQSYPSSISSHQYTSSRAQLLTDPQTLESFKASASLSRPYNRANSRYSVVAVLLLLWEDDDLGVMNEIKILNKVFQEIYLFDVKIWRIPSKNSHHELMTQTLSFVSANKTEDSLLIVYYGGHAKINSARQSTWMANRSRNSPSLDWSATQTLLETAPVDVLVLLDCCYAASAAPKSSRGRGAMEMIVACGYETISPEPGEFSFTNALIEVLEDWGNRSFNAVMLHNQLLLNIKQEKPKRIRRGRRFEMRRTPIYICTSDDLERPSIGISRLSPCSNIQNLSIRTSKESSFGIDYFPDISAPYIRVSLVLQEHQKLDLNLLEKWLSAVPVMAKYIEVEVAVRGIDNKSSSKFYRLEDADGGIEKTDISCPTPLHRQHGIVPGENLLHRRIFQPANDLKQRRLSILLEVPNEECGRNNSSLPVQKGTTINNTASSYSINVVDQNENSSRCGNLQDRSVKGSSIDNRNKYDIPIRHKTWADRAQLESPELLRKSRTATDSQSLEDQNWSEDDFYWDPNDSDDNSTENDYHSGDLMDRRMLQQFIDSSLIGFKKALVDLLMNEFHQIFGSQYMELITNCAVGSPNLQPSAGNWGERNNESAPTNSPGRRRAEDNDEDGNDSKDEEQPPKKRSKNSLCAPKFPSLELRYACPYYKHDPQRFNNYTRRGNNRKSEVCGNGWPDLGHMKEHLIRAHYEKFKCTRCKRLFQPHEFANHSEAPSACPPRTEGQGHVESGFSHSFLTFLRIRKRSATQEDAEKLWIEIYSRLFPNEGVPSPYMDVVSEEISVTNEYRPFQGQDGSFGQRIASDVEARFREQVNTIVDTVVQPIAQGLLGQAPNTIRDAQEEYHNFQSPSLSDPRNNTVGLVGASQFDDSGHATGSQWESRVVFGGLNAGNVPQPNFDFQLPNQNVPLWPQVATQVQNSATGNPQQNYWPANQSVYSAYGPPYSTSAQFDTPDGASSWTLAHTPLIDRTQLQRLIRGEVNAAFQQELLTRQNVQSEQPILPHVTASSPNVVSNNTQNSNIRSSLDSANNLISSRSSPTSQNFEQQPGGGPTYQAIPAAVADASPASREPNSHHGAVSPQQLHIDYQDAGAESGSTFPFESISRRNRRL